MTKRQASLETIQYVVSGLLLVGVVIIFAVFTVYDRDYVFLTIYNLAAEVASIVACTGYFRKEWRKRHADLPASRISSDVP